MPESWIITDDVISLGFRVSVSLVNFDVERVPYRVMNSSVAELIPRISIIALLVSAFSLGPAGTHSARAWTGSDTEALVSRMESVYRGLKDYQTHLVITGFGNDRSFEGVEKLTYSFKKPDRVRVDFDSPHKGMTIVYPDKAGRVVVRMSKWLPFNFNVHLDPGSPLVEISPGQRINQTDIGLLIRNIGHSLTDMYLGDLDVSEGPKTIVIRTLADNPFKRGTPTRYTFTIDKGYWLPVGVEESTADGVLKRRVVYENLRLNMGMSDSFFRLE